MKKLTLKQILAILLAAVTLLLASCTPDEPAVDTTTTEAPADDDTTTTDGGDGETTTAPIDDPVDPGDDNIPTVDSSKDLLTFTPGAPDKLVLDEEGNCAPIIIENYNEMAIDDLGRVLVTSEKTGLPNSKKWVGLFYSIWTTSVGGSVKSHIDVTKALACAPENPYYGSHGNFCWWAEPETGYHAADDVWQIRRDMRYFAMSGVDFLYMDFTNGFIYENGFKVMLDTMVAMREEGQMTPYIVPWALDGEGDNSVMSRLYKQFYCNEKYEDLWFRWEGKPLVMLKTTIDTGELPSLRNPQYMNFFTFRACWTNAFWPEDMRPEGADRQYNRWWDGTTAYGDYYYGWHDDPNKAEAIGIGVAGFATYGLGRSGRLSEQRYVDRFFETKTMGEGIVFGRGFKEVQSKNPECEVLLITRWNEWTAQNLSALDFGFVDQFNTEFSRDIEPMKGGFTDNYFYQMCNIIREFKGVLPAEGNTGAQTMDVNTGDFEKWEKIYPVFTDYANDTKWRNFTDPTGELKYINSSGRHDIVESRLTADGGMVYAYVRCAEKIASYNRNPNWMMLFIDADQNKETGWEGYDFVINYKVLDNVATTICAYKDGIWQEVGVVQYKRDDTKMMIAIPRSLLGLTGDKVAVDFHWMDNVTDIYDLHSWFTTGDSAPERRNNYTISLDVPYNASAETVIPGRTEGTVAYMPAVELTSAQERQLQSGLNMSVYSLPENYGKMPDIGLLEDNRIYTLLSEEIGANIGFKTSNYAIAYDGYVKIPEDGNHRFRIAADDGALLYIDGRLVAEVPYDAERASDGIVVGAGYIRLAAGYHTFRLEYAETGNGGAFLALDGDWELYAVSQSSFPQDDDATDENVEELELDLLTAISRDPVMDPKYIQVRNHGTVISLGKMDLSIYSQVEISYCSDRGAMLGDVGSFFALTYKPTGIRAPEGNLHVIAQGTMTNAAGHWEEDIRTVTIDLSEVPYEGDTYLAIYMGDNNGMKISSIKFTKAATPTPKPEDGENLYPDFEDLPISDIQAVSGDPVIDDTVTVRNRGTVVSLGKLDLSLYTKLEISYGSDAGAQFANVGTFLALTNAPDAIRTPTGHTHILAQEQLTNAKGMWEADTRTVTFDLSEITYNGTVYLALYMGDTNGVKLYTLRFFSDGELPSKPSDPTATYTVTFVNYDGTVLAKQENVAYGTTVNVPDDPTRAPDGLALEYVFKGWDSTVKSTVEGDATYTAQYTAKKYLPFVSRDSLVNGSTNVIFTKYNDWNKIATLSDRTNGTLLFKGWIAINGDFGQLGYKIDDADPVFVDEWKTEAEAELGQHFINGGGTTGTRFALTMDISDVAEGTHTVEVIYKTPAGGEVQLMTFTLIMPERVDIMRVSFDQLSKGDGLSHNVFSPGKYSEWDGVVDMSAGDFDALTAWGWVAINGEIGTFGYQIDDGEPVYNTAWTVLESDITAANGIAAGADTACRFKILISLTDSMTVTGNHDVKLLYKSQDGVVTELATFQAVL